MFSEKSEKLVEELIAGEVEKAVKDYGDLYSSPHEFYAVLKEEVEETKEIMDSYRQMIHYLWLSVRGLKIKDIPNYSDIKHLKHMLNKTTELIKEAAQVAAVIEKGIKSYERDFI